MIAYCKINLHSAVFYFLNGETKIYIIITVFFRPTLCILASFKSHDDVVCVFSLRTVRASVRACCTAVQTSVHSCVTCRAAVTLWSPRPAGCSTSWSEAGSRSTASSEQLSAQFLFVFCCFLHKLIN